jgi:thioredoxin-dependent peroxiredoxin
MQHTFDFRRWLAIAASLLFAMPALGAAPSIGSAAPDFKLQDQKGKWHTLSQYKGKWVALYFYPKDHTPGCTDQACDFRDNAFAFRDAGAVILGISVDDVESHRAFSEKHGLPFTLLADPTKQTAQRYGVMNFTGFAKRETYLIDPKGNIVKRYVVSEPKGHSVAVLKDIQALKAKTAK